MSANIKERRENRLEENNVDYLNYELARPKEVRKKRTCLMCGSMFNSKSASNRRCPKCYRVIDLRARYGYGNERVYKLAMPSTRKYDDIFHLVNF